MMHQVTAYEDDQGNLHKTKRDAVEADFIVMIQNAWGQMPDQRDRGDPVVIARILASNAHRLVREKIVEAISFLESHY